MKLEFRTGCLHLLIELFETRTEIRRHRMLPGQLEQHLDRTLRRRIGRQLRQQALEVQP